MQPHKTNPRRGERVFAASFTEGRQVVELWNDGEGPFTLKLVDFSARERRQNSQRNMGNQLEMAVEELDFSAIHEES